MVFLGFLSILEYLEFEGVLKALGVLGFFEVYF
uniref:Uncharacterized protein n=1 Tax=Trichinella nativa TaxID=6335 RepID=A0A0V1KJ35_9BILA